LHSFNSLEDKGPVLEGLLMMFLRSPRSLLKALAPAFAALALIATTSGCSYLFGPKPEDAKPFVKKNDGACVRDVPDNVKAWLKDGRADIGRSVDCAVGAINDFSKHVAGKSKNVYTEAELREFISEYLVSPDSPNAGDVGTMTEQILKVKQIILGGTADLVTKDELSRFKSILLRAKPLLIAVSPNIQTLLFNSQTASVTDVTNASANLKQILDLLAQEFDRAESGRPETGFRELLQSAHTLGLRNDSVADWIPLVESLKVVILSGDGDLLRAREWAPMIRTIGEAWGLALRLKYNLSGNPEMLGRDFAVTEQAIRQILDLLDRSVSAHGGSIPNEAFENLIDALAAKQMLPSVKDHFVGADTLKDLLPTLFGKLLYGRWHGDYVRQSQRFGAAQLARLRSIVDDWIAGQWLVNQTLNGRNAVSITQFGQTLASHGVVRKSFADDLTFSMAQRAQKQMLQFLSKGRPPIHDGAGRLIVVTRKELPAMSKSDLDSLNEARVVISSVLSGWTHDAQNAAGLVGLTEAETQEVYLDLRNLGHDLNFIDVRSNQAGVRTFMENAIFMSSSDGNAFMGLQEGVEWFNFVMSGSIVADRLWSDMEPICGTAKIDVLGNQKLEPQCFRREFLKRWTSYATNLPHLTQWARQDGSGQRAAAMLNALENAGRNRGASNELVDSSEFRSMLPIAHYLESMFARHDVNQNGILDNDELWNAFPLLAPFIKKMGNGKADSEKMQKAIYSYILTFGAVPSSDLAGMLKIGGWYLVHGWFKESADRTKVLGVIGAFPAASKAARVRSITEYYKDNDETLRALMSRKEETNAAKITDLFQCLPDASTILASDMALKVDALAPAGQKLGAETFIARMKSLIDSDPRLETYCLPF
jgi:hypothetical protein